MTQKKQNKSEQKQKNITERKNKCKVEVFSRVAGFFRPVQVWNEGKQEEFKDRKKYKI